jgi:hypothetical protein
MPLPRTKIFFREFDGLKEGAIVVASVLDVDDVSWGI